MVALLVGVCYLLGSLPVAWLVTRAVTGRDVRQLGSGNVGVMNVAVSVARWAGLLVLLAEAAKGVLAVSLARAWDGREMVIYLAALAAVVGTRWSVWLGGAGGRGNTAAMFALLVISWQTVVAVFALWLLVRLLTRRSFIATRVCLVAGPLLFGLLTRSPWAVLFGGVFSVLFASTHRAETDDHLLIKSAWPSLWAFLTAPPRK